MTRDQAQAEASRLWCCGTRNVNRPLAWHTRDRRCAIGYTDGEFRYCMATGATWDEALAKAKANRARG